MDSVLRNRAFRSLALGRLVTNAGDSLYSVAAMWLVWELSRSPGMTAVAGFLSALPSVLQLFAGPLVDRWPLRRLLVATQLLQAAFVLVVPVAAFLGRLTVPVVLVVMPLLALCNQLAYPAQSAAVPRLVRKEQLVSANSVLATAYQGANLVQRARGRARRRRRRRRALPGRLRHLPRRRAAVPLDPDSGRRRARYG